MSREIKYEVNITHTNFFSEIEFLYLFQSMVVAKKLNGREWFWLDNVPHVQAKVHGKEVIKRHIRASAKVEAFSRFICGLIARCSNGIFSRFICVLLTKVLLATM